MASAVDSRLAYARLSAATASRLPTANRGSNNSYTTSWDTTGDRPRVQAVAERDNDTRAIRQAKVSLPGRGRRSKIPARPAAPLILLPNANAQDHERERAA